MPRPKNPDFDEKHIFLWTCIQTSGATIDYAALAAKLNITNNAARKRFTRIKTSFEAAGLGGEGAAVMQGGGKDDGNDPADEDGGVDEVYGAVAEKLEAKRGRRAAPPAGDGKAKEKGGHKKRKFEEMAEGAEDDVVEAGENEEGMGEDVVKAEKADEDEGL